MSEQSNNFGTPLWIADNQISAVAAALKSGHIAGVQERLAGQALVQRQDLTQAHDGKTVTLWGREMDVIRLWPLPHFRTDSFQLPQRARSFCRSTMDMVTA